MATKDNPGEFDCYRNAADDEPIFTLRANDELAPVMVRVWAIIFGQRRHPMTEDEMRKYTEAMACAAAMEEWKGNS